MTNPKITVVLCTKRKVPHIEWALESLKNQTYKDFEYIIVDGLYNSRKDEVEKTIKDADVSFPVLYIPDKPTRWKGKRPALCNGRNTALIFAKGEYIVHHDDNAKLPENWIEKHVQWLEKGYLVAGNWLAYQYTDKGGKGTIGIFGWEYRSTVVKEPIETTGGWLYGGNFSFPLKAALEVNGFDEDLDGEMGQDDVSFGIRAERRGYKTMYDPTCYLEYYYQDHGLLIGSNDPNNSIWNGHFVEINVTPVNIKLKDGLDHFSNEFFMQELLEDSERYLAKGNTIDIVGTRKLMKEGNYSIEQMYKFMEGWVNANPYDWRDGKLIEDKVK